MIHGVGTDLLEVRRMEALLARGETHLETIFTPKEREYCEGRAWKGEHYAGRFAAKEAFLKALGTGWRDGLAFNEIEILNDEAGRPQACLHGKVKEVIEEKGITGINVSITHTRRMALAVVILET